MKDEVKNAIKLLTSEGYQIKPMKDIEPNIVYMIRVPVYFGRFNWFVRLKPENSRRSQWMEGAEIATVDIRNLKFEPIKKNAVPGIRANSAPEDGLTNKLQVETA